MVAWVAVFLLSLALWCERREAINIKNMGQVISVVVLVILAVDLSLQVAEWLT